MKPLTTSMMKYWLVCIIIKNSEEMNQENEVAKPDTLGLMLNTLYLLGCQSTANEDGTISVQYQGENCMALCHIREFTS